MIETIRVSFINELLFWIQEITSVWLYSQAEKSMTQSELSLGINYAAIEQENADRRLTLKHK
ncbi:hypothetical protein [Vibrio methylphosphonaticus]|uniref:hypothetical protein n=1 Tax=Vibrio methylphosphonaticus TaxID=2946866 RepID=UPI00202A3653|nr:hypothetical protein [Vibrio methylphosphonaticus]MCL9773766.1 hypothetical protein [Vibrio methylphosphonaticus]